MEILVVPAIFRQDVWSVAELFAAFFMGGR